MAVDEEDGDPLPFGQRGHGRGQIRLGGQRRHPLGHDSGPGPRPVPQLPTYRRLAHPPQIARGVGHGLQPLEVLPSPGERLGRGLSPEVGTIGRDQRSAQTRLHRGAEAPEPMLGASIVLPRESVHADGLSFPHD